MNSRLLFISLLEISNNNTAGNILSYTEATNLPLVFNAVGPLSDFQFVHLINADY